MMKFDAFVARRYLKAKRKQAFIGVISLITLLGITLGVAALNIALSIHNGMQRAFIQSLVGKTGYLYILAGHSRDSGFTDEDVAAIGKVLETVPGINGISMMRQESGLLISDSKRFGYCKLMGIVPKDHLRVNEMLKNLEEGNLSDLENRPQGRFPGIILGYDLAGKLGVRRGDLVRAAVPRLSSPGLVRQGLNLREMRCEVVGIFRSGNSQFDEMEAYLRLDELMLLMNTAQVQTVMVNFTSIEALDRAKPMLIAHPGLPFQATVMDLRDLNQNLLKALKLEKVATTVVICLFILIVGLNMVSALTMLVMEKHRDIGIMKSFGTPKPTILRVFIRQGMTLSFWGTLLGTALGVTAALMANHFQLIKLDNSVYEVLNYLPFRVRSWEVVLVAGGALLLSFFSALYPARQAANLDPVEALKYD